MGCLDCPNINLNTSTSRPCRGQAMIQVTEAVHVESALAVEDDVEARVTARAHEATAVALLAAFEDSDSSDPLRVALETFAMRAATRRRIGLTFDIAASELLANRPLVGCTYAIPSGNAGTARAWWSPSGERDDPLLSTVAETAFVTGAGPVLCADVLALDPRDARRWWRLTGACDVLGAGLAETALTAEPPEPVQLVRRPLDWARAGGAAAGHICVLDWNSPLGERLLFGAAALICADPATSDVSAAERRIAHGDVIARRQRDALPKRAPVEVLR